MFVYFKKKTLHVTINLVMSKNEPNLLN